MISIVLLLGHGERLSFGVISREQRIESWGYMARPERFVIATPICDGHDVAAVAITRTLRRTGTEAIYLGFNKSAGQIVKAAVEEDATAIAISTYNGGHMSFLREVLREEARQGIPGVPLFAGGGGTILAREVPRLERMGVRKVYRPPVDLADAVSDMVKLARTDAAAKRPGTQTLAGDAVRLARRLTDIEWNGTTTTTSVTPYVEGSRVWGIGGRGGAGKSTIIDELLYRFLQAPAPDGQSGNVAVLSADPTLGDRLRMLYCYSPRVFMRSVRVGPGESTEAKLAPLIQELRAWPFDLILVESVGLGQNELGVAPIVDCSVFCMAPEYGSDVQLEKEALLQRADVVVMNKRDFPQADARGRRVRNFLGGGGTFVMTEAKRHDDPGLTELYRVIAERARLPASPPLTQSDAAPTPVPPARRGYLGAIVASQQAYYAEMEAEAVSVGEDPGKRSRFRKRFESIWRDRGFDGEVDESQVQDGVLFRENASGAREPVARQTPAGIWVPVLGLPPRDTSDRQVVRYLYKQSNPGSFPFTEGAYPYRRTDEDPIRMFAGLGAPETTNRRFHLLAEGHGSPRLSTAFDSLTLYGLDSDEPGALAKVGEGGVAVDTVEDIERLYAGFDLERTSVSLTMNGPAPTILAMYLAAARRRGFDLSKLRGTIQTDILKEVQAQNESCFPLEPSLRLIADMISTTMHRVPSWYPISISGYHIGEAGANAIQELAFTLANAFTYVEVFLARGLRVEDFAGKLSFFFTSGSDLEFNVMGRVARRIWAVAMHRYYGLEASRSALKFHAQTSGRSLQEVGPLNNLTRVAIQAEHALHNNANSLHTNSYKETYTTPEEDDVLLAMGSQQIPLVESGDFRYTENLHQGAYGLSYLEDEVERAVHRIFREIDEQGGVVPAMENEYFRTSIQDEVSRDQQAARRNERKIVGVNYLQPPSREAPPDRQARGKLVRIPLAEKRAQVARTTAFKRAHRHEAAAALARLQAVARGDGNVFEELLDTVEVATVGQITHALWDVWGRFRPTM
jgi:methylmalonyl-CoA mutase